jgi:hypothetical protein
MQIIRFFEHLRTRRYRYRLDIRDSLSRIRFGGEQRKPAFSIGMEARVYSLSWLIGPLPECAKEFVFDTDETRVLDVPTPLFERPHFYRSEL